MAACLGWVRSHALFNISAVCARWRLFYPKAFKLEIWPCMLMRAATLLHLSLAAHINGEHVARNKVRQHSRPTWREFQITLCASGTHISAPRVSELLDAPTSQQRSKINAARRILQSEKEEASLILNQPHGMIEFSIRSQIKRTVGPFFLLLLFRPHRALLKSQTTIAFVPWAAVSEWKCRQSPAMAFWWHKFPVLWASAKIRLVSFKFKKKNQLLSRNGKK